MVLHLILTMKGDFSMFENFDDILNVDDVAKALKIGTSQAYKLVRSGKIQAFKEGRAWKIAKQALINYIMTRNKSSPNVFPLT